MWENEAKQVSMPPQLIGYVITAASANFKDKVSASESNGCANTDSDGELSWSHQSATTYTDPFLYLLKR